MPRFYCPVALQPGDQLSLPAGAARHVQVLRLQPGDELTLFNGSGGEFDAVVQTMGRSDVAVRVGSHRATEREGARELHLAVGMPANERMDWLVEKATELGVASIQPLLAGRSVLRIKGERAERKQAHWQAVAVAACEQCGRNRVPVIHEVAQFAAWLLAAPLPANSVLLSLRTDARPLREETGSAGAVWVLSGPEGGFSPAEEDAAIERGFVPATLGPRVLRAETAALAALAALQR